MKGSFMGTRGIFGIRKGGIDKAIYCHYDSYPEGLGADFLRLIKNNSNMVLEDFFDKITVIDSNEKPTNKQIAHCWEHGWVDESVSKKSSHDWYCLLRNLQNMEAIQEAIDGYYEVYIDNYIDFIKNSLQCEYAYIYDVDSNELEFYMGFQKSPQEGNRYGTEKNEDGYYPCKFMKSYSVYGYQSVEDILNDMIHIGDGDGEED